MSRVRTSLLMSTVLLGLVGNLSAQVAEFAVTTDILRTDALRIGTNFEPSRSTPWSLVTPEMNLWSMTPNIEPMVVAFRGVATGGSADELIHDAKKGSNGGAGGWSRYLDGFFNGATITIYRIGSAGASVLRRDTVKASYGGPEGARNAFVLEGSGPAIEAGDLYTVTKEFDEIPAGTYRLMPDDEARAGMIAWWGPDKKQTAAVRLDRTTVPPGGGRASLRVEAPAGVSIGGTLHGTTWDGQGKRGLGRRFLNGKPYTFTVWLRQDGMTSGQVTLRAGTMGSTTVDVGPEWKQHELHFTGKAPTEKVERLEVVTSSAGTLWLDNPLVTDDALPAFAFYPQVVEELKAAKPGVLRIWSLQENVGPAIPISQALLPIEEQPLRLDGERAETIAGDLHRMLELCEQVGAAPWIVVPTFADPTQWEQLAEYLAGSSTSPMGALRARRGREAPWTAAFPKFYLDCGNETWNRIFATQGFANDPVAYGHVAELMFQKFLASPGIVREQFSCVIGGWAVNVGPTGFGPKAAAVAPTTDIISYAAYIGGWDGIGGDSAQSTKWADMPMFYQRAYRAERTLAAQAQTSAVSAAVGRPVTYALYESGPGYELPGPSKPVDREAEAEGKSLARAVTVLDGYLSNLEMGCGPQNFFLFRTGDYWSSHANGWRPHTAWQAIALANRMILPTQVRVTASGVPTVDLPEQAQSKKGHDGKVKTQKFPAVPAVPLASAWAWADGSSVRVALLNRSIDTEIPVRLTLPFAGGRVAEAQILTGAPQAHNIEAQVVSPAAWAATLGGGAVTATLPPCAVAVLRIDR